MYLSRTLVGAIMLAVVAVLAACGGKFPAAATTTNCGDQCATMNCPPGSTCTLSGNCTPRCEQQPMPLPR